MRRLGLTRTMQDGRQLMAPTLIAVTRSHMYTPNGKNSYRAGPHADLPRVGASSHASHGSSQRRGSESQSH
jgi:hypothetical protein